MLFLFGLCVFMVAQELKPRPDSAFEIAHVLDVKGAKNNGDVGRLVDSADKKDQNFEKPQVAVNKAQNSRGEYGHAVLEAPKGGMVNEGRVVGADEGLVVDGKTKKKNPQAEVLRAAPGGIAANGVGGEGAHGKAGSGVQADRDNRRSPDLLKLNELNEEINDETTHQGNSKASLKDKVINIAPNDENGAQADVVDPKKAAKIAKDIKNRMHKKVEAMNLQEDAPGKGEAVYAKEELADDGEGSVPKEAVEETAEEEEKPAEEKRDEQEQAEVAAVEAAAEEVAVEDV